MNCVEILTRVTQFTMERIYYLLLDYLLLLNLLLDVYVASNPEHVILADVPFLGVNDHYLILL